MEHAARLEDRRRPPHARRYLLRPHGSRRPHPAECAVYFFGQGSGGSIPANIDRWKSQIVQNGKPAEAKVDKRTVHGLTVTTIESAGDYMGMQQQSAIHNYRLLGAIVEGPGGNVFIKFTGPPKPSSRTARHSTPCSPLSKKSKAGLLAGPLICLPRFSGPSRLCSWIA